MLNKIFSKLSLSLCFLLSFQIYLTAQNQITLSLSNLERISPTVFEFDIDIANTGTTVLRLSAAAPQVKQTGTAIPVSTAPTYELVAEGATFVALTNPVPAYNNATFRLSQVPIGTNAASIEIPTTTTKLVRVRITSNAGPIASPTLFLSTNVPNITLSAYVTAAAATPTTFSLAAMNLVLGAPLPVDLIDFTARASGMSNLISWVTATERNTAWHVVERSANGVDSWIQVGKVAGSGTTTDQQNYRMEDNQPLAKSYYRLRSVDFDGQEERSNVVLVTRKSGIFGVTGVYPSPTADLLNIQFESLEEAVVTIQVRDLAGRLVLEQQVQASKGENLHEVSLNSLAAGTYSVQLVTDGLSSAQVMVVKQ